MKATTILLAALAWSAASTGSGDLDGTQWKIRYEGPSGPLTSARSDFLMFDGGKMASARMVPKGFEPADYKDKPAGEALEWHSRQINADGQTLDWKGRRSGDAMTGTVTRKEPDGATRVYDWSAALNHPGD